MHLTPPSLLEARKSLKSSLATMPDWLDMVRCHCLYPHIAYNDAQQQTLLGLGHSVRTSPCSLGPAPTFTGRRKNIESYCHILSSHQFWHCVLLNLNPPWLQCQPPASSSMWGDLLGRTHSLSPWYRLGTRLQPRPCPAPSPLLRTQQLILCPPSSSTSAMWEDRQAPPPRPPPPPSRVTPGCPPGPASPPATTPASPGGLLPMRARLLTFSIN